MSKILSNLTLRRASPSFALLALCGVLGCGPPQEQDGEEAAAAAKADPITIKIDFPVGGSGGGGGGGGGGGSTSKAEISLDSQLIFFSQTCPGAKAKKILQLRNKGADPLIVSKLEASGRGFSLLEAPKLPKKLNTGERLELTIEFSPPANRPDQLDQQGALNITSNDRLRAVTPIALRGLLPAQTLTLSQRQIDLGEMEVGSSRTRMLTLRNAGQCPVAVAGFDASGKQDEGIFVDSLPKGTLMPGNTKRVSVTGFCVNEGDINVRLRFVSAGGTTMASAYVMGSCD